MSDLKENKLSNKETSKVNGGSHWHPGINHVKRPLDDDESDKDFPETFVCMDCGTEFTIVSMYDYEYQTINYDGLYCSNCRNNHRK